MDIDILREYLVFTKYLNITKASEVLHLAPSSLSRHLAMLEKEVGSELVNHGKPIKLTAAGLMVLNEATKIVDTYDSMIVQVNELNNMPYSDIRIAFLQEDRVVVDRVVHVLAEAQHKFPGIYIGQAAIQNASFFEALQYDEVDIAILFDIEDLDGSLYTAVPLLPDRIMAVLRRDGEFGTRSSVSIQELEGLVFYYPSAKQFDDFHARVAKVYELHGVKPNIQYVRSNTMDEFYAHDSEDRAWFSAESHIIGHHGSIPEPVLSSSTICQIEEEESQFMRYAVYKKSNQNHAVPIVAKMLAQDETQR